MEKTDILIIGAGVVGLAVAAEISRRFPGNSIVLTERHGQFGQETSSRNSEVIHAGIYYPTGSLKAKLCVEGNTRLYQFCHQWGIPHRRLGKLIVASSEDEVQRLKDLIRQGQENGVADLELLDRSQVAAIEPHLDVAAAILSPSTGIIDAYSLMARLEWQARQGGVLLAYRHQVVGIEQVSRGYRVFYRAPDGTPESVWCRWLINSAGLAADQVASWLGIDVDREGYRIHPCKGEYFTVSGSCSHLVSRLVYPPPLKELKSLGIHLTKTLDGRMRLGPNAFYVDSIDYRVEPSHAEEFYQAAKGYLPFLELDDLQPDLAGIRPKLQAPGEPFRDFIIRHEAERGLEGVINLVGLESPGLTSCLSVARLVGDLMEEG
ncbi:MAG: NAD(P)/FAD-dependent oxidoreductase [Syntrophomonadaceae bacterium]|nr:NAD(P)/FAD-dependent oxidoreductase [Syntrophomonadaceae bacterium]